MSDGDDGMDPKELMCLLAGGHWSTIAWIDRSPYHQTICYCCRVELELVEMATRKPIWKTKRTPAK